MPDKILVVDDEVEIADLIEVYLNNENYSVFKFYSAKEALECINTTNLDLAILDVHAEATSEKLAMAYVFDGRVQVIFGTHTHVPTADEQILPKGSGYVTDLGMCGPVNSILGTNPEQVVQKFRTAMPTRLDVAPGPVLAHGVIFDLDPSSKKVTSVKRITF